MKRLLWIDDDNKLIEDSIAVFKQYGFHILKASTPSAALRALRQQKEEIDGVLLDVRLGGDENGIELLDELHQLHPGLRVVVFTAYPDYSDQVDAKVAGALAYFAKIEKSIPLAPEKQKTFFTALHRLFPDRVAVSGSNKLMYSMQHDSGLWFRGLFFLTAFIVITTVIAVMFTKLPLWLLPLAVVTSILFYVIVCAFLLRTQPDYGLSEKGFLSLMKEAIILTPKLLKSSKEK